VNVLAVNDSVAILPTNFGNWAVGGSHVNIADKLTNQQLFNLH
jgi:hypothetical protein